jgi:hypothetical protein
MRSQIRSSFLVRGGLVFLTRGFPGGMQLNAENALAADRVLREDLD